MSSLCRCSRQRDVSRLKALWKGCFGDEDAYIDHYFKRYYQPERALVLEHEGTVVSMLLTFPIVMDTGADTVPACYIYAFCTDPAQQGKGWGRRLLTYAEEQARAAGCAAAVMVPGEQSLFDFYAELGYETACVLGEETKFKGRTGGVTPRTCSAGEYGELREKWLKGLCHASYGLEVLEYQRALCRNTGGGFYTLGQGAAAVEIDGDTLYVKELLTDQPEQSVSALLALLGAEKAEVRLPVLPGQRGRAFGVVKWLEDISGWDKQTGWLAFGFD